MKQGDALSYGLIISMFGNDIFMVIGIVQPKAVNKKTFQLETGKTYLKGERGKRGKRGKGGQGERSTFITSTVK